MKNVRNTPNDKQNSDLSKYKWLKWGHRIFLILTVIMPSIYTLIYFPFYKKNSSRYIWGLGGPPVDDIYRTIRHINLVQAYPGRNFDHNRHSSGASILLVSVFLGRLWNCRSFFIAPIFDTDHCRDTLGRMGRGEVAGLEKWIQLTS
jgi:hypothetical protein